MSSGFVTEADVAERRRVRQEEWEKNKKPGDPEEPPEEAVYDPRSLFDRLQEQKTKKQEEYDEAHKFKNMVRGLEDDEVDFLDLVDRSKLQEEQRVRTEENIALAEYRKKVEGMKKNLVEEEMRAELKAAESKKPINTSSKKTSHISLLAGAIKRKASDDDTGKINEHETKKPKPESENEYSSDDQETNNTRKYVKVTTSTSEGLQCIAILPGMGCYTDSSNSDNTQDSDSDDEEIFSSHSGHIRDITGRVIKLAGHSGCQGGC